MENFDNFFDGMDTEPFDSGSQSLTDLRSNAHANDADHASFFADYEVDGLDEPEDQRVDSLMDVDENVSSDPQEEVDHDAELALKLASKFRSYNLRPTSVRDGKAVWITWLDTDDTGNYDPNDPGAEERMGRSSKSSSSARRRRSRSGSVQHSRGYMSENDLDDERRPQKEPAGKYLSELAARQQGVSLTITFDLTTHALQKLAATIPDHWPGEDHNILSDEHFQYLADQLNSRDNGWKSYNLRRRDSCQSELLEDGLWLPDGLIEDPLGVELDLRNHPAARGCKGCRELGEDCSLLADGTQWPCVTCLNESCDCELITPPERRLACEHCQRKRLRCSYVTDESETSKPCSECATQGFVCVAGPHPEYVYQRIDYCKVRNQSPEPILHDRKYTTCTECRSQKKSCSLKTRFDYPPCESCQHDGMECTFLPLSRKQSASHLKKAPPKKKNLAPGQRHIITTALNHPVHFLHENEAECAWCMQNIGVVGRGMRDITVVAAADGLSYKEIAGGENASGRRDDHMCMMCTLERSRIIGCREHELRPIEGIDIDAIDIAAMLERIAERSRPVPTDLWCAVCPAPALYQCCTLQTHDSFGQRITDPRSKEANGCSLLLCEDCAVSYGEFQNLDRVIDAARDEPEIWVLGQRADAEFLKQDGLLVKNMMVGFEGDDMDIDE